MARKKQVAQGRICPGCKLRLPGLVLSREEPQRVYMEGQRVLSYGFTVCPRCLMLIRQLTTQSDLFCEGYLRGFRIALDLDGVIADLTGSFTQAIHRIYMQHPDREALDEYANWHKKQEPWQRVNTILRAGGGQREDFAYSLFQSIFHEDLGPILGLDRETVQSIYDAVTEQGQYKVIPSQEELLDLLSLDADIAIVTSRPLALANETIAWLAKSGIRLPIFFFSEERNLFLKSTNVFVEDRLAPIFETARRFPLVQFILFEQPWNCYQTLNLANVLIERVSTWKELLETIRRYESDYVSLAQGVFT